MPSHLRHVTVDCADPYPLAEFWAAVVGGRVHPDSGEEDALVECPKGPGLLFLRVPEGKTVKNRLHLDLEPEGDATRDEETERIVGLGAVLLADFRGAEGTGFMVLADPEGNEFCVERGESERGGESGH